MLKIIASQSPEETEQGVPDITKQQIIEGQMVDWNPEEGETWSAERTGTVGIQA